MKSEIGFSVLVLKRKQWGKTLIDGKIRSEKWWRQRLEYLINEPIEPIPTEHVRDGHPVDWVTPLEVEFNIPDLTHEIFLKGWQRMQAKHA